MHKGVLQLKNYFVNGVGLNFSFPIDGDCVNEYDGELRDGVLYLPVRLTGQPGAQIVVNETDARETAPGVFEATVPLFGYRCALVAQDRRNPEHTARVTVFRLNDAVGGCRLSSDDNIIFLWDIHQHRDTYRSIFENPYLAVYKKAHDLYGITVHLNLFYAFDEMDDFAEDRGSFNLSMMTDKFRDEWIANSDWLRLSFHARTNHPDMPYRETDRKTIREDCLQVQNEIIRFAGRQTLSDVTTVHWGECTAEGMRALREVGVQGAAGYFEFNPDGSTLVSYYYPKDLVAHVGGRDFWVDTEEDLVYGRIDLVLNLYPLSEIRPRLEEICKDPHRAGFLEIMIHEEYFYSDYMNYIPEFEQIVLEAASFCRERGCKGRNFSQVMLEKRHTK